MKGRTKLVSLVTILGILLTVSLVFASGFVDVSTVSLFSEPPILPDADGTEVFVDPGKIIVDYIYDSSYQIGNTFVVHINVSDVTDLFSYQVNVTWNTDVLNFTGISEYGEFLARTGSTYGTSRIQDIYVASNETGYACIAETILGNYAGISGNGRLVTIEFEIVGYGYSNIGLSELGPLGVFLLDSSGTEMPFTTVDGYFRNALLGDATLDGVVDVFDVLKVKYHRSGPPPGPGGYIREVDINDDGSIDVFDILIVKANLGRGPVP